MERDKCEGIIQEFIKFKFDTFILNLSNNRKLVVDIYANRIGFTCGYLWFGKDGIMTTIDYRIIESIGFDY